MLVGLSVYAVGAVIFGKKLMTFLPLTFGYHEIFHICTVISASLGYLLLKSLSFSQYARCSDPYGLRDMANNIYGPADFCCTGSYGASGDPDSCRNMK